MTPNNSAPTTSKQNAAIARFHEVSGTSPYTSSFLTYGYRVKTDLLPRVLLGALLTASALLTACGTHPAKDYGGSWKPVNRFQDKPSEIPLTSAYTFYASPMDGTLKSMLSRWATDSGMKLSYQLQSDFTLFKPVTQVHTTNISDATHELSTIYAAQGVSVSATDHEIIVQHASAAAPAAGTK